MVLRNYFSEFKPFLLFLARFLFVYILLTVCYFYFLEFYSNNIDAITANVAFLTQKIAVFFGLDLQVLNNFFEFKIIYKNKFVARIVEGCNAVSLLILFVSFVIGFTGSLQKSLIFIFFGCFLVYLVNVFRIILLVVLLYYYPKLEHILHGVVFPLVIYSLVFLLCIVWVNKFSNYASK